MKTFHRGRGVLGLLALVSNLCALSCSQQSVTVQLRSLQSSGDVSYVCADNALLGAPLEECSRGAIAGGRRNLLALVTQTSTGEVAVINVPFDPDSPAGDEGVIDVDPSTPGYGFLHVGARPTSIVSTPGGRASFVAVADPVRPGIFGLPTPCIGAPRPADPERGRPPDPARDITLWPACALPTAPGKMQIAIDAPVPDASGALTVQVACGEPRREEPRPASADTQCPADLTEETVPPGRRKLLVSLPDFGTIAVIDAQALLDREPGTFAACPIEREFTLSVDLPPVPPAQVLPGDLTGCPPTPAPEPAPPPAFQSRPSGMALADGTLYVGDETAPVVHVLDVSNPCEPVELPPLLPRSFDSPDRVVVTSGVSVSPLTPSGKRFVYAIDLLDTPSASLMVFDVSPGASDRTPIVRPGSPFLPFEAPDRIQFSAAVRDVEFVLRDRPEFDAGEGTLVGESCNPDPSVTPETDVGAKYRPDTRDYQRGARASELRGVFATALLTNGSVSFIDVEDFDQPCRRPAERNTSSEEDFRGCAGDDSSTPFVIGELPTVTDEVSCRMVEPHRARSQYLGITRSDLGIRAPSLRAFPALTVPDDVGQRGPADRPKLLAVDFPDPLNPSGSRPAEVFVGSTRYVHQADSENELVLDPELAEQFSVALPFNQPRAYPSEDSLRLTYEGTVLAALPSGFFQSPGDGTLVLDDPNSRYCDGGVNDVALASELGAERFALTGAELAAFAENHTDYVVIRADFPDREKFSDYWENEATCTPAQCEQLFGEHDADELAVTREFRILDAQQSRLVIEPRSPRDAEQRQELMALADCCFPSGTEYDVRASQTWVLASTVTGLRHNIIARSVPTANGTILDCVRDCNPRKRYFESRVFEIAIGAAEPGDACVASPAELTSGVQPGGPAAGCIHATATARFAVYRGGQPSVRDMRFSWTTSGGFQPLSINLQVLSGNVVPQSIVGLPDVDWLTVVDSASLGLSLLSLDELTVLTPTLN